MTHLYLIVWVCMLLAANFLMLNASHHGRNKLGDPNHLKHLKKVGGEWVNRETVKDDVLPRNLDLNDLSEETPKVLEGNAMEKPMDRAADGQQSSGKHFRQAPFCVDSENTDPEEFGLVRFEPILAFHMNNSFVPATSSQYSPSGAIEFGISPVSVNDLDSGYNSVLKNYVHIKITSKVGLQGLYVQAISAPWGIPFGEFMTFDCGDCGNAAPSKYKSYIQLIPCMSRPALSYYHPNVFTVGGKWVKGQPRANFTEMHFNFRYVQYPGVDHTFAQFLVVAVRKFHKEAPLFETYFTQIYELNIDDNPIGAYYPFYSGWKTDYIKCHNSTTAIINDFKPWSKGVPKAKIRYSYDFDNCILKKFGIDWLTCPPGPLSLDESEIPLTLDSWKQLRQRYTVSTESSNGASSSDLELGAIKADKQFCADAGIWDWTMGSLDWEVPQNVVIKEIKSEESASLTETLEQETAEEEVEDDDEHCRQEEEGEIICRYELKGAGIACDDYHGTICEIPPRPQYSKGGPTLTDQFDVAARKWGSKYLMRFHGLLMVFSWTAAFNILAYVGRFQKEDTIIERKSSYFGIGQWLWSHIWMTYVIIATSSAGVCMTALHARESRTITGYDEQEPRVTGLHDLCNLHNETSLVENCVRYSHIHRYCGILAVVLFLMSYGTGWGRPESSGLRKTLIIYHFATGYLSKLVAVGGTLIFIENIPNTSFILIIVIEVCCILTSTLTTVSSCLMDSELHIKDRKMCPVPEAIDTFEIPRGHILSRAALCWFHIVVQLGLFIGFVITYV